MKLAMVTPFPEKANVITGGVEGVAHCLIEGLLKIGGLNIHVVAPCSTRPPGLEKRDGITIHWLRPPKIPAFLAYWSVFRKRIHRCIKEINPDITHFQGVAGWTLGYKAPFILTIHGIYEKDVLFTDKRLKRIRQAVISKVEKIGRIQSKNIILINPYVLNELREQIRGNFWNIENPVTGDFFEIKRRVASPCVLYVGRINQRKNISGLINAFATVKKKVPDASLRLAGRSESTKFESECHAQVARLGLADSVQFLGNLDRFLLKSELSTAACLVLVSFQETAPMVVEEAMAAGVPVVASKICGLPFMVKEGKSGYLVEPGNEHQIASSIFNLLHDHKVNEDYSRYAKWIAIRRFHSTKVAQSTFDIYKSIIKNGYISKRMHYGERLLQDEDTTRIVTF